MCSSPMESRTKSSETPAEASSSAPSWRWVVVAGWQARDLASPIFTRRVINPKATEKKRLFVGRVVVFDGQKF